MVILEKKFMKNFRQKMTKWRFFFETPCIRIDTKWSGNITLLKSDGSLIIGPINMTASQNFTLAAGALPSKSPMTTTATTQAQAQLISNILDRLSSTEVLNAIQGNRPKTKSVKKEDVCKGYISS